MKKSKNSVMKFLMGIGLGILFLLSVGNAQAGLINWTETTYDAMSGDLVFTWDENSIYGPPITTEVDLKKNDIQLPTGTPVGTLYEFVIPNFFDPLPMKIIEVTMVGSNGGAAGLELATVLDIIGADSPYDVPGPAYPVDGVFVSGTLTSELVTELWHMFPNPDFEIVKIYAPVQFELASITIETQSVPLPQTILLLGSGLVALLGIARRRMK